jgi:hypothetical protein
VLVDVSLPVGKAANAAAVLALTMGARQPHLVGEPLIDATGHLHPGLIPIGITILGAPGHELRALRAKARSSGLEVIDFPVQGQQTTNYGEFRGAVSKIATDEIEYVGIILYGDKKKVSRIVGKYPLLNSWSSATAENARPE